MAEVSLRDLPTAGPSAWMLAVFALAGFVLAGVSLAAATGSHHTVTSTTTDLALMVFGLTIGLLELRMLDQELREVAA